MKSITKFEAALSYPLNVNDMPLQGQQVIEASAGTGKTYNITRIFLKLLLVKQATVEQILIVTFTKAATQELKGRIASETNKLLHILSNEPEQLDPLFTQMINSITLPSNAVPNSPASEESELKEGDARPLFEQKVAFAQRLLKQASLRLDEASIFTIHSFCQRIIKQTAFMRQQPFSLELVQSSASFISEAVEDWFRRNQQNEEVLSTLKHLNLSSPHAFIQEFSSALSGFIEPELMPESDPLLQMKVAQAEQSLEAEKASIVAHKNTFFEQWDKEHGTALLNDFKRLVNAHAETIQAALSDAKANKKALGVFEELRHWLTEQDPSLPAISNLKVLLAKKHATLCVAALNDSALTANTEALFSALLSAFTSYLEASKDALNAFAKTQKGVDKIRKDIHKPTTRARYSLMLSAIQDIRQTVAHKKQTLGFMDHDDTIAQLASAVQSNNETVINYIQDNYPYALIDEFQDTDSAQFSIFSRCYPPNSPDHLLLMIGDPKQAIYGFRGGDINTYLGAYENAFPKWSMQHNFRSSENMIDAYNTLFYGESLLSNSLSIKSLKARLPAQHQEQGAEQVLNTPESSETKEKSALHGKSLFAENISYPWIYPGKKGDGDTPVLVDTLQGAIQFQLHRDVWKPSDPQQATPNLRAEFKKEQAEALSSEVIRLCKQAQIGENPVQLKDIAVLVASKGEAKHVQTALAKVNVPSVFLSSRTNIFTSDQAKSLFMVLDGILHVKQNDKFLRALSTDLFGKSPAFLHTLLDDDKAFDAAKNEFFEYKKLWEKKGVFVLVSELIKANFVNVSEEESAERSLTNYMHLAEILNTQSKTTEHAYQLLNWFNKQIPNDNDIANSHDETTHQRLESDDELLKIVTLHGCKGLEYPIVFIPFAGFAPKNLRAKHLVQFSKTSENNSKYIVKQVGENEHAKAAQIEEFEQEQLRLLYVGITRAVHRCYLGVGKPALYQRSALYPLIQAQSSGSDELCDTLSELHQLNPSLFNWQFFDEIDTQFTYSPQTTENTLSASSFSGNSDSQWQLYSFSRLSKQTQHVDLHDKGKDDSESLQQPPAVQTPDANTPLEYRFSMERSADTGTLLHNLLEDHDFTSPNGVEHGEALSADENNPHIMVYQNAARVCNVEQMNAWLNEVLSTPLPALNEFIHSTQKQAWVSLHQLKKGHVLKEPEFYFPMQSVAHGQLMQVLNLHRKQMAEQRQLSTPLSASVTAESQLSASALKGMMHGFIDLLFEHDNKYYVADYKSNHLGNEPASYNAENMTAAIQSHQYDLQYVIYSWALDRFLQHKLGENYDRASHFGGVYYLFLRGMSPNYPIGTGVYAAQLSPEVWQALDTLLDAAPSQGDA